MNAPATEPIAWYSEITGRRGVAPLATANSDAPGSGWPPTRGGSPRASRIVGAQSMCDTGVATTRPGGTPGPATISGTPALSS